MNQNNQKQLKNFEKFTNLYELSKTLRFELKPVGETLKFLDFDKQEKKKYFPKDKEKAKNYQRIKYYIDLLHRDFIKKALTKFKDESNEIDLKKYFKNFKDNKTEDKGNKLKKEITNKFTEVGKSEGERICETYKLKCLGFSEKESKNDEKKKIEKLVTVTAKGDTSGVLFGKEIIGTEKQKGILETLFCQVDNGICSVDENGELQKLENVTKENKIIFKNTEGKEESIFKNFKGFTAYFGGFHENRKNLYKNDGKAGRMATRIIDENLPRFCVNIIDFKYFTDRYPQLVEKFNEGWEEYFEEKTVGEIKMSGLAGIKKFAETNYDWKKLFEVNFYNNCLLQNDIDTYNYILRKLNKDINEFKQELKAKEKENKKKDGDEKKRNEKGDKKKLRSFQELYKQILGEVKKKSDFIEVDIKNIGDRLKDFISHSDKKKKEAERIIDAFVNQENFDEIYFSNKAINTISSKWFSNWHVFGEKILEYLKSDAVDKSERLKKDKKKIDFVSLENIRKFLESDDFKEIDKGEIFKKEFIDNEELDLTQGQHWQSFLVILQYEFKNLCDEYKETKETLEKEIDNLQNKNLELVSQNQKRIIKAFADSSLNLYQMTKYFAVMKGGKNIEDESKYPKNSDFYNLVDGYLLGLGEDYNENNIFSYYNALRNFLTKKPWSDKEKIKLNFENGSLLTGWSQSKEDEYKGTLFKKDGLYYLGIIKNKGIFNCRFMEEDMYSGSGTKRKEKKTETIQSIWKQKKEIANLMKGDSNDEFYEKTDYFLIADAGKDVQALLLSRANYQNKLKFKKIYKNQGGDFSEIGRIKKGKSYSINEKTFNEKDLHTYINYFKFCMPKNGEMEYKNLKEYITDIKNDGYSNWKCFDFEFSDTVKYKNFPEFTDEVRKCGYKLKSQNVSEKYIDEKVESGELYLFQIYNKDFSEKANGNENVHTKLFKLLFANENLRNPMFKLSGGSEIFFREKTDEKKLGYRESKKGETRTFIDRRDGDKEKNVVKNRRYTKNKVFFHLPITLNFGVGNKNYASVVNQKLNDLLINDKKVSDKIKIIGIDRGEKHLAYYSVINTKGEILDQGSFNKIYEYDKNGDSVLRPEKQVIKIGEKKNIDYKLKKTDEKVPYTDYQVLLDFKEKKRLVERQSWTTIENIKELKEGYISHVVYQLCNLIFKYLEEDGIPPIIVFENLNTGFKQGRQKIEKQTYQKLELRLAQKLNFLTQKNKGNKEIGGNLKALQLTPKVDNFGADIEKSSQVGNIFYVDPSYTSTTCPNCGFRKRLTKTQYESVDKTKEKFFEVEKDKEVEIIKIIKPKIQIEYNDGKYKFTFTTSKKQKDSEKILETEDVVYSDVERLYWDRDSKTMEKINNVTDELDKILKDYQEGNISENIKNIEDAEFWKKLMWCLHLILQIRNSENKKAFWNKDTEQIEEQGEDRDFLECPHCHFHSEKRGTWQNFSGKITDEYKKNCKKRNEKEEFNGDANGAYNTARKWIVQLKKIQKHSKELLEFKEKWGIKEFPKNKDDKKEIIIDSQKYILSLEGSNYQLKKKGAKKGDKIENGKKISKYPDLYVSNTDWDNFTQK